LPDKSSPRHRDQRSIRWDGPRLRAGGPHRIGARAGGTGAVGGREQGDIHLSLVQRPFLSGTMDPSGCAAGWYEPGHVRRPASLDGIVRRAAEQLDQRRRRLSVVARHDQGPSTRVLRRASRWPQLLVRHRLPSGCGTEVGRERDCAREREQARTHECALTRSLTGRRGLTSTAVSAASNSVDPAGK
jgi:hypothetical protein